VSERGPAPPVPIPPSASGADKNWTVLELLRWTTEHFSAKGIDTARLDAECLLAHALGTSRLRLYLDFEKPVLASERTTFREFVRQRGTERVPVSQLLGEREFWSLRLSVTSDVLTPRPETEILVETALQRLADPEREYRVLDIGTGSGAIALALGHERPHWHVTATDISPSALQIAQMNADELHIGSIRFLEGNLLDPVAGEQFDLIVSNPPYLARAGNEFPPELDHEPDVALFGGDDGYEVLRPLISEGTRESLSPGGWMAVEVDPGQAETVAGWFADLKLIEVETLRDLARHPRVVIARRPPGTE